MQANHSVLGNQAFGEGADSLTIIKYRSHHDALSFLQSALRNSNGIGLLHGPEGAGKTVIARELALQLSNDSDVAFVNGKQLKPNGLLTKMLTQFGFQVSDEADEELLKAAMDFCIQQTRSWQAPILIIDNVDRMYPSTLRLLNTIAAMAVQGRFALRLVLTGDKGMQTLVESDGMTSFIQRDPVMYSLLPLSAKETMIYLHARMQAAGSERADTIFPFDVCDRLREQSGGWPGKLNAFALEAIKRSAGFPVSVVDTYAPGEERDNSVAQIPVLGKDVAVSRLPPKLIVTRDGKTLGEHAFKDKKLLIGRSDFADIMVDDDYVSKIHAVLLLYTDALVLLDLNSANGTTVNSVKVSKTILKDDDVISLGHHRLKVENAPPISEEMEEMLKSPDTIKMKNLIDLRRQRARRQLQAAENRTK
jgi:type II secretory pathway predicted ATPase ExeA/pSer/pThr/pTyr-binding forkhead associated (FHA) protein